MDQTTLEKISINTIRRLFFNTTTVNTPARSLLMKGVGSVIRPTAKDEQGDYLDESRTYNLNLPADPPAKDY
jgi:hypothetical protein